MEFSAILVSQLESQRQYFETQMEAVNQDSASRITAIEAELEKTRRNVADLESKVNNLTKEKNALAHKYSQVSPLLILA